MTISSPGSHRASRVAAMASVAPTVTRTLGLGVDLDARTRPAGESATARRSSGTPALGGYWLCPVPDGRHRDLAQLVGAVGVGEALAQVDRIGGGGQLRHGGEDRRGEGLQPTGQIRLPRWPPRRSYQCDHLRRLSSGRTVLSIANYNMHCGMDGWGRPYDYTRAIALPGRRRDRARGGVDHRRRRRGRPGRRGCRRARLPAFRPHAGRGAPHPAAARCRPPLDRPARCGPTATGRSTWTGVRPLPDSVRRAGALAGGGAGDLGDRRAGATRTSTWSRRGWCP